MWLNDKPKRCRGYVVVGLATIGLLLWFWRGPYFLFRLQVWLLINGSWSNLDHWIDHANWYLPYLIEETNNITPVRVRTVRLSNRAVDSWEAFRYNEVCTVSDCVREVLHATVGDPVGGQWIDSSKCDSVTDEQRKRIGRLWKEWYAKHKHRLRWDSTRKVFMMEGSKP